MFGWRSGLGRGDISRMILLESAKLVLTGCAVGLFIAAFVTKPLAMFLVPGLKPAGPLSFTAVFATVLLTGLIAAAAPMPRAISIDPITSLRHE